MPWQTGLCSCMSDKSSCCDAIFCFPCQMGRQCNAVDNQINTGNCGMCILSMIGPAPIIMNCLLRIKVVDKYQIGENKIVSCCFAYLCFECSFCQTHRELTLQNAWPGGACCQSKPMEKTMA